MLETNGYVKLTPQEVKDLIEKEKDREFYKKKPKFKKES